MKVISIGTDRKIFEAGSAVRQRQIEYGNLFEELHLIVFSSKSQVTKENLSQNVFAYPTNSKSRLFYIWDAYKIAGRLATDYKLLSTNSAVTTQDPFETGLVGLMLKWIYKLPLQVQAHTDFANKYFIMHSLLNAIRFAVGEVTLSFADSIRVVSKRIAKSVRNNPESITVLPIYTKDTELQIIETAKEKKEKTTFLTVGRLEKEKDLETAIRAFAKAKIDGEFIIVGDGSQKSRLQSLVNSLQLNTKVKFVGWQNDLDKFYREADVYVSTSLYEGYGMAMVEAASYNLPLIITDAGVAGELFFDGKEAFIFKPGDVTGFSNAMVKLSSGYLREIMGRAAGAAAKENSISHQDYLNKFKEGVELAGKVYREGGSIFKRNILLRYLVAGITAASTNILLLFIFTDIFKIWYLYSQALSFILAIVLSFILQKFWTFDDKKMEGAHQQLAKYIGVGILGLAINSGFMYFFVSVLSVWYILAQIITGAFIAIFNFLMYKFFIFHKK